MFWHHCSLTYTTHTVWRLLTLAMFWHHCSLTYTTHTVWGLLTLAMFWHHCSLTYTTHTVWRLLTLAMFWHHCSLTYTTHTVWELLTLAMFWHHWLLTYTTHYIKLLAWAMFWDHWLLTQRWLYWAFDFGQCFDTTTLLLFWHHWSLTYTGHITQQSACFPALRTSRRSRSLDALPIVRLNKAQLNFNTNVLTWNLKGESWILSNPRLCYSLPLYPSHTKLVLTTSWLCFNYVLTMFCSGRDGLHKVLGRLQILDVLARSGSSFYVQIVHTQFSRT